MRSSLRWHARPLFLLVLTLSAVPVVFAGDAQWIEVKSPHFSVVTDAGEKRGRETAMRFEQMRAVFDVLMTRASVNIPVPLQIVAFRNNKEMQQFAPLWNGKPVQVSGQFPGAEDRNFIMLDMSVENPWSVVFHELSTSQSLISLHKKSRLRTFLPGHKTRLYLPTRHELGANLRFFILRARFCKMQV